MATQLTNYQCPACTGPLHFDGASGKLVCDFCGSSYDTAEIEALYAEKEAAAETAAQNKQAPPPDSVWSENEAAGLRSYSCPSCGAELICDASTAATSCPYCGNPTVVPGQFSGALKPDFVLPFKLSKEDAVAALKNHYKGKPLLPKAFTNGNHIEEIQGVYVPFWMFDGQAEGTVDYEGHITHVYESGDYEITETEHYDVRRGGSISFEKVLVDASSKMPDDHMDAIEPFDYSDLKPFSTAYLPGFLADRYDEDDKKCAARVLTRMKNSTAAALHDTLGGYTGVQTLSEQLDPRTLEPHYALLPVWMLHTRWKEQDFLFAMNGQTGKLIGDLPVDKGRVAAWFAGISIPLMILTALIMLL